MGFKELREKIENLIEEANKWIKAKSILKSSDCIEEAQKFLKKLKEMVENDVQERSVTRLTEEIEWLAENIDEVLTKRDAGKIGDGNVAFKCNWNDMNYKAPCSKETYEYNLVEGRAWCSSPQSECRKYTSNVTLEEHPCYESIALKEMYFAAGWDHTGGENRFRRIHNVQQGKMAILTTRPPGTVEKDRLVIGCLYINKVEDDPDAETKIYGDKKKSIVIDYGSLKIYFWDYYKNPNAEKLILWASGLFRYITDETVFNILKGVGEKYKNDGRDTKKIINLVKYYEEIIENKKKHNS